LMAADPPVLQIRGPLRREDLPALYSRACVAFTALRGQVIRVDVTGVVSDAVAVDALARLALAGRRHGCQVMLLGAGSGLRELITLMGLERVFLSPGEVEDRTAGTAAPYPRRM
jgi:ABC-type transporter Mla MlaB component